MIIQQHIFMFILHFRPGGDSMAYIGVQRQCDSSLFGSGDYTVANGGLIQFNTNLEYFDGTDTTINYSNTTNTFTFTKAGYYYVDWFVVLQSAFTTSGPTFSLVARTGTTTDIYQSTSSFKTGTLSGSAIVPAQAGTTLALRNDSGAVAILANNITDTSGLGIVANISIIRYVQDVAGIEAGLTTGTDLASGDFVPYNTLQSTTGGTEITNADGVFTVNVSGVYIFDWMVSITGMDGTATEMKFELKQGGTTVVGSSVSPVVHQGYITGTAIVSAAAGQTFSLYNSTVNTSTPTAGVTIKYEDLSLKATMRIFTLV